MCDLYWENAQAKTRWMLKVQYQHSSTSITDRFYAHQVYNLSKCSHIERVLKASKKDECAHTSFKGNIVHSHMVLFHLNMRIISSSLHALSTHNICEDERVTISPYTHIAIVFFHTYSAHFEIIPRPTYQPHLTGVHIMKLAWIIPKSTYIYQNVLKTVKSHRIPSSFQQEPAP